MYPTLYRSLQEVGDSSNGTIPKNPSEFRIQVSYSAFNHIGILDPNRLFNDSGAAYKVAQPGSLAHRMNFLKILFISAFLGPIRSRRLKRSWLIGSCQKSRLELYYSSRENQTFNCS